MKRIRIKIKHILVASIVVVFGIPNILALYASYKIDKYMKEINTIPTYVSQEDGGNYRLYPSAKLDEGTVALLESLGKIPTVMNSKGEIYNTLGKCYYKLELSKVVVNEYSGIMNEVTNIEGIKKAIEYFKKGVDLGNNSKYYVENLSSLVNLYLIIGEREKVVKLIEENINSESKKGQITGKMLKVMLLGKERKYDEALEICIDNLENPNFQKMYLNLLIMTGKTDEHDEYSKKLFLNRFGKLNEPFDTVGNTYYYLFDGGYLSDGVIGVDFNISSSHAIMNRKAGNGIFKGRVLVEGKPVPYALVYIVKADSESIGSDFEASNRDIYYGYTDKDGYFEIDGINNGKYFISAEVSSIYLKAPTLGSKNKGFNEIIIEDNTIERELEIN